MTYIASVRIRAANSGQVLLEGSMDFTAEPYSPDAWGWWYLTAMMGPLRKPGEAFPRPVDILTCMRGQSDAPDVYVERPDGSDYEWLGDLGWSDEGRDLGFPNQAEKHRVTLGDLEIFQAMIRAWWPGAEIARSRREHAPMVTYDRRIMELVPVRIPDRMRRYERNWARTGAACPLIRTEVQR